MVAAATICISTSAFADSLAYEDYTQIPLSLKKEEGTLIFSDCPEYADTTGILYEGTVEKGEGRLYYYHVNETGAPARLVVYAKADKKQPLTMKRAIRGMHRAATSRQEARSLSEKPSKRSRKKRPSSLRPASVPSSLKTIRKGSPKKTS